jgi:sn-glycerol 3-phosphate transport system ATP-binding protein
VVYVTHDQTEAMSMADQVVLLSKGRIEQAATPRELYAQPATTFAASFIGTPSMNLVRIEQGQIAGSTVPRGGPRTGWACGPSTSRWAAGCRPRCAASNTWAPT